MDLLSEDSRREIEPMEILPDPVVEVPMPEDIDHAAIHRQNLENRIQRIDNQIARLREQMRDATSANRRGHLRDIDNLEKERAEALGELQQYQ